MTQPQRKILPHGIPSWIDAGAVFFLTVCCKVKGKNQLCCGEIADVIFEAVDFRQRMHRWYVHLLLLMPDHRHCLVSFPVQEDMRKSVAGFKEAVAKRVGVAWQRDFFDHRLRSEESFDEKAHYIRMNPVRKGLVAKPDDWPWGWQLHPTNGAPGGHALPSA